MKYNYFILFMLLVQMLNSLSQTQTVESFQSDNYKWHSAISLGTQMSGIKNEDFIVSNYSPKISFTVGYWFSDIQALRIGYTGSYFYTISDKKKHHYSYFFGEAVFRMDKLFQNNQRNMITYCIHIGSGYLYNNDYRRPNICANVGISFSWYISPKLALTSEVSTIMGWDIYQGDEDILPGVTFGIHHAFGR